EAGLRLTAENQSRRERNQDNDGRQAGDSAERLQDGREVAVDGYVVGCAVHCVSPRPVCFAEAGRASTDLTVFRAQSGRKRGSTPPCGRQKLLLECALATRGRGGGRRWRPPCGWRTRSWPGCWRRAWRRCWG